MLILPVTANTQANVNALLEGQTPEGRGLDYKRDLGLANDQDKRELARDVSSFANAGGGFLIFGIEEAKDAQGTNLGYPEKILGVDCQNYDATVLRIESILRDHLDPRIQGMTIHRVDGYERGPVLLVHIPKSWTAPHMVSFTGQTHFYSRNGAGKHPLDVREIRAAFLSGTEVSKRIQRFRDDRLGQIVANQAAMPLEAGPKLVVHVCPLSDDAPTPAASSGMRPLPLIGETSITWTQRYNLDGFLTYVDPKLNWGYSLSLRDGSFEGVSNINRTRHDDQPLRMYGLNIEKVALGGVEIFSILSRSSGYQGPLSILVALLGAKGSRIAYDDDGERSPLGIKHTVDRDAVILPDVLLEPGDDIARTLHPIFDAIWQSSGWERSRGYKNDGAWDVQAHRDY